MSSNATQLRTCWWLIPCRYSGGRDGAICAWDLNLDLKHHATTEDPSDSQSETVHGVKLHTKFQSQTQAHTHWVNDIVLAQNNTAVVSASSDLTVRVWRPLSEDAGVPQTIGQHSDYVKCLASLGHNADWVASGGLDRKICLWDLSGAGQKLEIGMSDEERSEKGSVYALSVSRSMLASGGPESIVRLWDPRSGQRITKFVGHTDNIRSILINENEDTIMTASSDNTVKVWSVTAGRCMHTLTMHNDSVWSLYSDDPSLGVFYSGDRSGLVVKTDVRGALEMDDGLSLAVAHEHDGITKVIASGGHIWTATASSSINRWTDVDTGASLQLPRAYRHHRSSSAASKPSLVSPPASNTSAEKEIPARSILRISNTARYPTPILDLDAAGTPDMDTSFVADHTSPEPIHRLPEETIEGQHGLVKHRLLNDRRRVLTLDTAGDVVLWDILQCVPIEEFGKRHLEDVEPEVNTMEAVAPWCSVDTRTGRLAVVLEEYNCFDAEMYADEIVMENPVDFRDDQRINLGKWVLRHIFSRLIDEMIKRDEGVRQELKEKNAAKQRALPPSGLQMPTSNPFSGGDDDNMSTPRGNGGYVPMTPGMGIGVATPAAMPSLPGVMEEGLHKVDSQISPNVQNADYFSNAVPPAETKPAATPTEPPADALKTPALDNEKHTNGKDKDKESGIFGKKFKMSFGSKKTNRSPSMNAETKPVVEAEKAESTSETSEPIEKEVDDSFAGVIQKIHQEYERHFVDRPEEPLDSLITPSLPTETPVLKPPVLTTVIIQEETSGGSADLYCGSVGSVGKDADFILDKAPMWLGDLLLRNRVPFKEPVKVSFVLQPWQNTLPGIAGPDG